MSFTNKPDQVKLENPKDLGDGSRIGWYRTNPYGLIKVGAEGVVDLPQSLLEDTFTSPEKADLAIKSYVEKRKAIIKEISEETKTIKTKSKK